MRKTQNKKNCELVVELMRAFECSTQIELAEVFDTTKSNISFVKSDRASKNVVALYNTINELSAYIDSETLIELKNKKLQKKIIGEKKYESKTRT